MQTQLRTRLLGNATVASLCGTRVDWNERQQGKGLPAISLAAIADARPQHMTGLQVTRQTLVQVDIYAASYPNLATLREAAIAELVPAVTVGGQVFLRSFIADVRESQRGVETGIVHQCSIDIQVTHVSP